jgi:hypothetical protein
MGYVLRDSKGEVLGFSGSRINDPYDALHTEIIECLEALRAVALAGVLYYAPEAVALIYCQVSRVCSCFKNNQENILRKCQKGIYCSFKNISLTQIFLKRLSREQ